ncbi:MAG: ATP-binding cassette domain-containing protein, partial [Synergistaceae bacterium]|nr:ATP-binding cassette domain-containing protein [Synergistaceae bacterium]
MDAIEFADVSKAYGQEEAVRGVSMSVPDGAFVVLMGASGSGKTTMLKMVNRLISPSSGRVFFYGEDTAALDAIELRKKIGYVLQSAALFPHMTVAGNIAAVPEILG